ncbi:MAG: response regulator [Deltaproteobacteria bacterium]|nr:response regulator [Deltaproteobacteria bacterium]
MVVDDEKDIADIIAYNLEQEGYGVCKAYNGRAAWDLMIYEKPDLILLDLMMPGISGMDLCKMIRSNPRLAKLPIIMLTARTDPIDKVVGLEMGADDYITKPFHVKELIARIRAVLRRTAPSSDGDATETFDMDGFHIDFSSHDVSIEGHPIILSAQEFKLLKFFVEHPNRVYTRDQLLDYVWGDEVFVESRTVDTHISRLRALIEPDKKNPRYLHTVRGTGYKFGKMP